MINRAVELVIGINFDTKNPTVYPFLILVCFYFCAYICSTLNLAAISLEYIANENCWLDTWVATHARLRRPI